MYNKIILHILSAILKGIVMLVTNSESNGEYKRKYIEYTENIDEMINLFLTQGDNNGK
jgi:hypothetical protein